MATVLEFFERPALCLSAEPQVPFAIHLDRAGIQYEEIRGAAIRIQSINKPSAVELTETWLGKHQQLGAAIRLRPADFTARRAQ